MALTILSTCREGLVTGPVVDMMRDAASRGGATLLVPTFDDALHANTELARGGLSIGLEVDTPRSWASSRWDVWGDGRTVVGGSARLVLMTSVVEESAQPHATAPLPGVVRLLCALAERCLPLALHGKAGRAGLLTDAEEQAVELLEPYVRRLEEHGLVEVSEVLSALPGVLSDAGVATQDVVVAGFSVLPWAERELLVGLARQTSVTLVVQDLGTAASNAARAMADAMRRLCAARGISCTVVRDDARRDDELFGAVRADELSNLLTALFEPESAGIGSHGAVRLLEPSGPLAEGELVAREVCRLADRGMRDVVVAVPDVRRAWRELVPKLTARSIGVMAHVAVPLLDTMAGRAFFGYARTVGRLLELDRSWPEPVDGVDGRIVRLGSMSWWPPQELVDFMLCELSRVDPGRARALDISWRGDRLLTPRDVLAQLLNARTTSDAVERATRELLRGRLGSAASKLLAPYAPAATTGVKTSLAREEAIAALAGILGVAGTLKELGLSADPKVAGSVPLSYVADRAQLALRDTSVVLRLQVDAPSPCRVRLMARERAAQLPPSSTDAMVVCGLTSESYPVPTADDTLLAMLVAVGAEQESDPLDLQRASFAGLAAAPRHELLLERTLLSTDAKQTYPAVMLVEATSCYATELPRATLGEDEARANVAASGRAPAPLAMELAAPSGSIDERLRALVTVPQEGMAQVPGGLSTLSASQIESYLECPLKWFSLRRLRLRDNDAGFSPLEMGTFIHRVLELTYAQVRDEELGTREGDLVRPLDGLPLERMHEVLDATFALHEEHQFIKEGRHAAYQALVAHTSEEEAQMVRLRQDLHTALDYQDTRLQGFVPTLFEWGFGRRGNPVTYAGVRVTGTVDRIDVDSHGLAVIIDYKHKRPEGFFGEYAIRHKGDKDTDGGAPFGLPRRIQALMYAQIVRRAFPELKVVGALYLATKGAHELSGAVSAEMEERVFGTTLSKQRAGLVLVDAQESFGLDGAVGMEALLDATEQEIARRLDRLRDGDVEAQPIDAAACSYCPVRNCERRMGT